MPKAGQRDGHRQANDAEVGRVIGWCPVVSISLFISSIQQYGLNFLTPYFWKQEAIPKKFSFWVFYCWLIHVMC